MIETALWNPQPVMMTPTAPPMSEKESLPPSINPDYIEPIPCEPPIGESALRYLSPYVHYEPIAPFTSSPRTFRVPTLKETTDNIEFYRYKVQQMALGVFEGLGALSVFYVGAKILGNQNSPLGRYTGLACLAGSGLLGWQARRRTQQAYRVNRRDFYFKNVIKNTDNRLRLIDSKMGKIAKRYEALCAEVKAANKNFGKPMTLRQMKTTRRNLQSLNDQTNHLLTTLKMVTV